MFSRFFKRRASLAVVVVLPEPCKPTIRIGTGGVARKSMGTASLPKTRTSSSLTILMTCWPGVMERVTSEPVARVRTCSTKARTTSRDTSASIKARRISRKVALTSASLSAPRPVIFLNILPRRSLRLSNIHIPRGSRYTKKTRVTVYSFHPFRDKNSFSMPNTYGYESLKSQKHQPKDTRGRNALAGGDRVYQSTH